MHLYWGRPLCSAEELHKFCLTIKWYLQSYDPLQHKWVLENLTSKMLQSTQTIVIKEMTMFCFNFFKKKSTIDLLPEEKLRKTVEEHIKKHDQDIKTAEAALLLAALNELSNIKSEKKISHMCFLAYTVLLQHKDQNKRFESTLHNVILELLNLQQDYKDYVNSIVQRFSIKMGFELSSSENLNSSLNKEPIVEFFKIHIPKDEASNLLQEFRQLWNELDNNVKLQKGRRM